MYNVIDLICGY